MLQPCWCDHHVSLCTSWYHSFWPLNHLGNIKNSVQSWWHGHTAASVKGLCLMPTTLKLNMEYNPDSVLRSQTNLPVDCNCIFTSISLIK